MVYKNYNFGLKRTLAWECDVQKLPFFDCAHDVLKLYINLTTQCHVQCIWHCIHAGTLANVIGAAITTMTAHFDCDIKDIRAAIGPSIGPCCYEVGMDVEKLFRDNPLLSQCMEAVQGKSKMHLNLQKALRLQLEDEGISSEHIDDSPSKMCTYCNEERFYSYRRDGRPFGTHVGFIGLKAVQ